MKSRLFVAATALAVVLMLAGAALAAPSTLSTFSVTPASAAIGTSVTFEGSYDAINTATAFCFYFASADAAAWNVNFTTLNSVAGVVLAKGAGSCPAVTGYGNFFFYTNDTSAAVFGDTFSSAVTVPAVASGVKIIAVRQYSGTDCATVGGGTCDTLENFKSVNLTVTGAPTTVYVGSSGAACTGYSPCYTDLNTAYNAVAAGGVVRLIDAVNGSLTIGKNVTLLDHTGAGTLTNAALVVTSGTVLVRDLTLTGSGSAPVFQNDGGTLTVKGNAVNANGNAVFLTTAGTTIAYANNFSNFGTGITAGGGTINARHNWWGSVTPTGVNDADAFAYRLGADVEAWGEGTLGGAAIAGGTGTGVIVSHGRGDTNAPFGKATLADGNTQCSDYYDYFVAPGGSGNWQVTLPIDAGGGCDAIYNLRQIAVFAIDAGGAPNLACSPDTACWNPTSAVNANPVVQLGRNVGLRWTASTVQLSGTPLVAANQRGNDPTAVTMRELTAQAQPFNWALLLAAVSLVAAMSAAGLILRRRFARA